MSIYSGPQKETRDLIYSIDPANPRSYTTKPSSRDHGISNYYCFSSLTMTYASIYPYTDIYEINGSTITKIVSGVSTPSRGTFSAVAGRQYFGTKAVCIFANSSNFRMMPMSLCGRYFGGYSNRYGSSTYFIYSLFEDVTISVYDNVVNGINGTATSTINLSKGQSTTYVTSTESNPVFFVSTHDIFISCTEASGDRLIIPPADTIVYTRRRQYRYNLIRSTLQTDTGYVIADDNLCFNVEIGDGSGGDCCQGVPASYISDTY